MLPKACDQTIANRYREVASSAHRIAGIGIDQVHNSRLMLRSIQIRFDNGDSSHVRKPSHGYFNPLTWLPNNLRRRGVPLAEYTGCVMHGRSFHIPSLQGSEWIAIW